MAKPARRTLIVLVLVFFGPFVGAYVAYRYFPPDTSANYGELLLPPAQVPLQPLVAAGGTFRFADLGGKWVLVASDSGACAAACQAKLTLVRQVWLALGKNRDRVERVFVADDLAQAGAALLEAYPGMRAVTTPEGMQMPPGLANDRAHIYVVDPLGNVMMRFPARAEGKRMLKDLERLLKASSVG
jgi:cytochrome oxidase Cu insertion factor (SCO1/SenC/PrrC family)